MQPVRTALFAPGIKERVMSKALESGADAVILDLEDSVPLASKAEARALVAKAIDAATNAPSHPAIYVRVNAASTGLLLDDLEAVVRARDSTRCCCLRPRRSRTCSNAPPRSIVTRRKGA